MIRLLTAGVRTGLVATVVAATVPMITFAQTTEPAIEVANASPTVGGNGADNDTSAQTPPPARPAIPASVEVEFQHLLTEHRSEVLDDRAESIDRWLVAITIVLGFFAIVAVMGGYMGFSRFREIEAEAKNSVKTAAEHAKAAGLHVKEIKTKGDEADKIFQRMNAQTADDPDKARQAVKRVEENPEASLIDQAIARAILLQQDGKRDDAREQWRAIAQIAEGNNNALAARAWFSVGYLFGDQNPEDSISANNRAIGLKPDYAAAYINRGNAKDALGQSGDAIADYNRAIGLKPDYAAAYYNRGISKDELGQSDDAIADYDEAIRLKPDLAEAYTNRGIAKAMLGQRDEAITDHDEAIRLKPDYAAAYNNRGIAKVSLKRYDDAIADYNEVTRLKPDYALAYLNRGDVKVALGDMEEARKDFETALQLARNAGNANIVSRAEQSLHNLNADGG